MNCDDVEALLDDFADGTLTEAERRNVARHIAECSRCRAAEGRLRTLLAVARAMPRGVEPAHELWPAIAERIQREKVVHGVFGPSRRQLLAAAVVVVAAALGTFALVARHGPGDRRIQAGLRTAPGVTAASYGVEQAQATYTAARAQLLAALEAREETLAPETREVVEKNLRIIDQAVGEMQAALARDPGNRDIPGLLVAAYQQEIDLLQRVTTLPGRG